MHGLLHALHAVIALPTEIARIGNALRGTGVRINNQQRDSPDDEKRRNAAHRTGP